MKKIEIKKIVKALNASDGAGVKLKRSIGTPEADYIDPFLMLDEFGSENKDDYSIGVPSFKNVLTYFNNFVVLPVPGGPNIFLTAITLSPCCVIIYCD